jgi:hypothetical protein
MADGTNVAVLGTGIMGATRENGLPMPVAEAIRAGHGEEDMAAVYQAAKV